MTYCSNLYTDVQKETSLLEKLAHLSFGFMVFFLVWMCLDQQSSYKGLIVVSMIVSFVIPMLIQFMGWGLEESFTKTDAGIFALSKENIDWNGKIIEWENIDEISMSYSDYKGKFVNMGRYNYKHKLSAGIDNKLSIVLKNGEEFNANFLIRTKHDAMFLEEVLWEIVKTNAISYENAKKMVYPRNYAEHQELKSYCRS